ncbi:MAG: hydroxyacid dehydrogenase [Candidatus Omnitrophica bacterium]|nr:hydroxyacid dehydrogenase [Candidatus Omnitrophota bacterium]
MFDVVFYEAFEEERAALKKFLGKNIHARFAAGTVQESGGRLPPARLISVRTQSRIPPAWAQQLDGIFTRSQGYDHLLAYRRATGKNIACGYIDEYCSRAVAEQAVLAMMALLRKLKKQLVSFEKFSRDGLTGSECRGRRALVVGVGNIGAQIVDIARGLRMEVRGVDPRHRLKSIHYVSLKKGLEWADVIFCSCALTDSTTNLLDYAALRGVRKGAIFINVARGEISPAQDMERLLARGILGGVALDVFDGEDRLADYLRGSRRGADEKTRAVLRLQGRDDVLLTPHNAFNSREALEAKARLSAQAVRHFLRKGAFPHAIPSQ